METDKNKKYSAASETTRRTRRVLDETFKTKVVLEALKNTQTVNKLAIKRCPTPEN